MSRSRTCRTRKTHLTPYTSINSQQQQNFTFMYIQETENSLYSTYFNKYTVINSYVKVHPGIGKLTFTLPTLISKYTSTKFHVHVHPGNGQLTLYTLISSLYSNTFKYIQETEKSL